MPTYHRNIVCLHCGRYAPHRAKHLCATCYSRQYMAVYYMSEVHQSQYQQSNIKYQLKLAKALRTQQTPLSPQ